MTREDVLREFAYTRIDNDLMALENEPYTAYHEDQMADEIVRLRTEAATLEIERAAAMDELARLERQLAALNTEIPE